MRVALLLVSFLGSALGNCMFRDACGTGPTPLGPANVPCPYNGTAQPLPDDSFKLLQDLCPDFVDAENNFCCSAGQVADLQAKFVPLDAFAGKCRSCQRNLHRVFCQMTCNSSQSTFLEVTETQPSNTKNGTEMVKSVDFFMNDTYARGAFDSCKNVQLGGTSILAFLCQQFGPGCTYRQLFETFGTSSPFALNFTYDNPQFNFSAVPCWTSAKVGESACSCGDCPDVCTVLPLPHDPQPFRIGKMDGYIFVMALIYSAIFIASCVFTVVVIRRQRTARSDSDRNLYQDDQDGASAGGPSTPSKEKGEDEPATGVFYQWGLFAASHPYWVLAGSLLFVIVFCAGTAKFQVTTDPVELWSAPDSQARVERRSFNEKFGPFYRVSQVIIRPKDDTPFMHNGKLYGSIFRKEFFLEVMELQNQLKNITAQYQDSEVQLSDICFSPMGNGICTVQSAANYFQNNPDLVDKNVSGHDYLSHIETCVQGYYQPADSSFDNVPCLGDYGGPNFPYVVLGGMRLLTENNDIYTAADYMNATALNLMFLINNSENATAIEPAIAWEREFVKFLKNYSNPNMTIAYMAEISVQDELARESESDVATIVISYILMFTYVSIALGRTTFSKSALIHSQISLGLGGVLIVLLSVVSSVGFYSYIGVSGTLIIIEVVPFLVLAVGVDNIFILVQAFQRAEAGDRTVPQRVAAVVSQVGPSMFLASASESVCFFLGALTSMPAVKLFALYAATALVFDFLLQMSAFVALLALDAQRQENKRYDVFCCFASPNDDAEVSRKSFLHRIFSEVYAPKLRLPSFRLIVVLVFSGWFCASVAMIPHIDVGLDQDLSMPQDSYLQDYFHALNHYLCTGPPMYFVVSNYDYLDEQSQNLIIGGSGASNYSLGSVVSQASRESQTFRIVGSAMIWLDEYISWTASPKCCRIYSNGSFCPSTDTVSNCSACPMKDLRPANLMEFLPYFLDTVPGIECSSGGRAAYKGALQLNDNQSEINAAYYMTYHSVLRTSREFTTALERARFLSNMIQSALRNYTSNKEATVFAYSIFYVFYEQYITVWHETALHIGLSLLGILIITSILLGPSLRAGLICVAVIVMIIVDLMGVMYLWNISLNAVSLVNLVMAIGISVEFIAHVLRAFLVQEADTRVQRAMLALANTGSSVLSGITFTKFVGVAVLAFAKSQLFVVFYFRMYLCIVLVGAAHGLIFLPVLLSIIGPAAKRKVATD